MAYQVLLLQKMVNLDKLAEENDQDFEKASSNPTTGEGKSKNKANQSWRIKELEELEELQPINTFLSNRPVGLYGMVC